jgi:hypothetical protein
MAINQDITNLPTPPSRSDSPSDFSDKADSFLGALPQLQTELNTYADEANSTQTAVNTSASNAATSEQNAEQSASESQAFSDAAAAIVNAAAFEATTTYNTNDAAIGSDGNTYRSLVDNNTGNDPVTDDGSNWLQLTNLSTVGSLSATASGALADGDTVVVNSNGTVSSVSASALSTATTGTEVEIDADRQFGFSIDLAFDPVNKKVLVTFSDNDNSDLATGIVGTVSGTTVSFGTPTTFGSQTNGTAVVYDPDTDQMIVVYIDDAASSVLKARTLQITGDTFTVGTEVTISSDEFDGNVDAVYDTDEKKVFVMGTTSGPSFTSNFDGFVGTVSGTSLSFGSVQRESSTSESGFRLYYDEDSSQVLIGVARDSSDGFEVVSATISGSTASYNTPVTVNSGSGATNQKFDIAYDEAINKLLFIYADQSTNHLTARTCEVDGTGFTVGSAVEIRGENSFDIAAVYEPLGQSVSTFFQDGSDIQKGKVVVGTISGTTYSVGSLVEFHNDRMDQCKGIAIGNTGKVIVGYDADDETSTKVQVLTAADSNITSDNFIGFSDGSYSDTQTATIQIIGAVNDTQSGLTAGQKQYVQADGTLSESAGSPEVFAGTAVSATKIIVKG